MFYYASCRYTKESGTYLPVNSFRSDAMDLLDLQRQVQCMTHIKQVISIRVWVCTQEKNKRESVKYHVSGILLLKTESVLEHEGCFQCYYIYITPVLRRAGIGLDNKGEWIIKPECPIRRV